MEDEKTQWQGSPSQLINIAVFLVCALAAGVLLGTSAILLSKKVNQTTWAAVLAGATVIPLGISVAQWLIVRCQRYELTTERLLTTSGVFSRSSQTLELYRVKDYALEEPFYLRLFGLGNLVLTTHDETNPTVVLHAVPGARALRDDIRKHVEVCRDLKRVRIAELE